MTGIGQLNFSIDSDAGFTPQQVVNNKEPIVSQQTHQLTVSNQPASMSNNIAVTIAGDCQGKFYGRLYSRTFFD